MRRVDEFGAAMALLTRLPGGRLVRGEWPAAAGCVWAYPVVGLLVGGLGAVLLMAVERVGIGAWPASVLAVAATACLTGGLHEDGLADTFDALGGRTVERRLAIMRDSRIGAHGALALALAALLRVGALASLPPARAAAALVAAGVLGRASMLVVLLGARPARSDGLAASLGGAARGTIAAGLVLGAGMSVLDWRWGAPAMVAGGVGLGSARLARRWFGGLTGDVLGACEILSECAVLLVA